MSAYSDKDEEVRQTLKQIEALRNAANMPLVNADAHQEIQLEIKIDNSLPHGQFFPSHVCPGQWRATEQTFKAMKKNIFAIGDEVDELKEEYTCHSCKTTLDKQFWHFCPYCGERFLT